MRKYIEEIVEIKLNESVGELRQQISDILIHQKNSGNGEPALLTYSDISKEFKISLKTLKQLKKTGALNPLCKGGKSYLFERSHVIKVLQSRPRIKPNFIR